MKLVIDEKLKHRLIGVAVILSLGAIFAPAMMKKSNQNTDNNYNVQVKLPVKPKAPDIALADEKEVFKTIKIAKVHLPEVDTESKLPELAKAERIQRNDLDQRDIAAAGRQHEHMNLAEHAALNNAVQNTVKHAVQVATAKPLIHAKPTAVANKVKHSTVQQASVALKHHAKVNGPLKQVNNNVAKVHKPAFKSELYAVQLASFSHLSNAQSLVNKLRSKGYKANFTKISGRHGAVYKVYAGHSPKKMEVVKVKTQLAHVMQLNGFIVTTGVS